jgi:hypothetical protein
MKLNQAACFSGYGLFLGLFSRDLMQVYAACQVENEVDGCVDIG